MYSTRCFISVFILYIFSVSNTQGYDNNACPKSPMDGVIMTYGTLVIQCGEIYDKKYVANPPTITFPDADPEKFYEVIMVDPDAIPSANPTCIHWLHMFLSNVKGSDLENGIVTNSGSGDWDVVAAYMSPGPPKGDGYHRYVEAAFSHDEPLNVTEIKQRCGFKIDVFTRIHNLQKKPDAFNMFKVVTN